MNYRSDLLSVLAKGNETNRETSESEILIFFRKPYIFLGLLFKVPITSQYYIILKDRESDFFVNKNCNREEKTQWLGMLKAPSDDDDPNLPNDPWEVAEDNCHLAI